MEPVEDGTRDFQPFKKNSVNLIAAPTNTGKSFLVSQIIKHRHIYLPGNPVGRVIFVLCDSSVKPSFFSEQKVSSVETAPDIVAAATAAAEEESPQTLQDFSSSSSSELEVIYLRLEDFSAPDAFLQEQDLVVFEDVHFVNPAIRRTIDVLSHHLNLCSTFIICQALIGRKDLWPLLDLVHNILLLFNSNAVARCVKYVADHFFHDHELKDYLKQILAFGQKFKQAAWLEVNSIANQTSKHLAITSLNKLSNEENPHCFVHPQLFSTDKAFEKYENNYTDMNLEELKHAPPNTFLLVPAKNVKRVEGRTAKARGEEGEEEEKESAAAGGKNGDEHQCAERERWNEVNDMIEERIQNTFDHKKWKIAKNLAIEILSNPELCVSDNGRWIMMRQGKGKRHSGIHPISLMDFLIQCTRSLGPNERPTNNVLFKKYVKILLDHSTPAAFIRNKGLFGGGGSEARANKRRRRQRDDTPPLEPRWLKQKDRMKRKRQSSWY